MEHWSGPDQAVLHTVSVHFVAALRDRAWDDAPPGYLAAPYLLASKERPWQPALPLFSHDSIDFSRIVSKPPWICDTGLPHLLFRQRAV